MLQLLITVGGISVDYTKYLVHQSISIQEQLNIPTQMTFQLEPIDRLFVVPPQLAYVSLYSTTYQRSVFTGFVTAQPVAKFIGTAQFVPGGQMLNYSFTCTSDEYLLNVKAIPFIPAYVNRTQGQILSDIANQLCPGFFDTSLCASGDIVPYYQYDPTQSWAEVAKSFADGIRYRYHVKDKQIVFAPYGDQALGVQYNEATQGQSQFDPQQLATTVLGTPLVNDVTIIGDIEAGNNHEDYFLGDGFTGNFPLLHKVFRGSSTLLVQDSWQDQNLNLQQWLFWPPNNPYFDLSAGALNVVTASSNPFPQYGLNYISMNNGLEMAGGLDIEHGEFTWNDSSHGIVGGIYADTSFNLTSLIGGFQIGSNNGLVTSASGAAGVLMQPIWASAGAPSVSVTGSSNASGVFASGALTVPSGFFPVGAPTCSEVNHTYVLQTVINAPVYTRYKSIFRTVEGEEFGGDFISVSGNVTFIVQDFDIALATGIFYEPRVTQVSLNNVELPSFVVYALLNNIALNVTIDNTTVATMPLGTLQAIEGPSGLMQPTGLILPMLPTSSGGFVGVVQPWPAAASANIFLPPGTLDATPTQLVLGNGFELQAAQVTQGNESDTLGFYAQTLPAGGTPIRFQSWEAQSAVSRLQNQASIQQQSFIVGDDGIRSAIVQNLNPLPRTSEDADNAALAYLKDRSGVFYNGTYTCTSYFFQGLSSDVQFYPTCGRFLNVNAPYRGVSNQKFLVTALTTTVLDLQAELLQFQFQFGADTYLEKMLAAFTDLQPKNVLSPQDAVTPPNPRYTQYVTNTLLPDLNNVQVDMTSVGPEITINVFDPYNGPIEVRSIDSNWGRGATYDLIAVVTGPSFSLTRQSYDQVWYMRPVQQVVVPSGGFGLPGGGQSPNIGVSGMMAITSRRSKVIRMLWPLPPLVPKFVSATQTMVPGPGPSGALIPSAQFQLNFNGDQRNIFGLEIRAADNHLVLLQKPIASYADLNVDLSQTPFPYLDDESPVANDFYLYAYFFNQQWDYSPPLLLGAYLSGIPGTSDVQIAYQPWEPA